MQNELLAMLKSKGTGKTMGKSLSDSQLSRLPELLCSTDVSAVTKATLLTALLALPPEPQESAFIHSLRNDAFQLPPEVQFLLGDFRHIRNLDVTFTQDILAIISGESLSEERSRANFKKGFDEDTPAPLVAAFLEGLRLKEETAIENHCCYELLLQNTKRISTDRRTVIDLSVGYDGFTRTPYLVLFAAPILAALGYAVCIHGLNDIGPKHGVNFYKLLELSHYPFNLSADLIKSRIESADIGWAYLDQSDFCPMLFRLQSLRNLMLKRPLLSTLEKLLVPVTGNHTLLVTSYTHPPYKSKMTALLDSNPLIFDYALVRGAEGSIQLATDRKTPVVTRSFPISSNTFIRPEQFELQTEAPPEFTDVSAESSLDLGLSALSGHTSWANTSLVYFCASVIHLLTPVTALEAIRQVRSVVNSGQALHVWEKGIRP